MKPTRPTLLAQSPSGRLLFASATLVAAAALISLKSSANARSGEIPAFTGSQTVAAAISAIADPALGRLIDLHRRATYAPGALAQRPQGVACCGAAVPR